MFTGVSSDLLVEKEKTLDLVEREESASTGDDKDVEEYTNEVPAKESHCFMCGTYLGYVEEQVPFCLCCSCHDLLSTITPAFELWRTTLHELNERKADLQRVSKELVRVQSSHDRLVTALGDITSVARKTMDTTHLPTAEG